MGGATESTKKMYYTAEEEEDEEEEEEKAAVMMPIMCGDLFDDLLDFPNDADDIMMLGGGGTVDPSSCADAHHGGVPFTPATTLQNEPSLILPPPLHVECDDGLLGGAQGGVMIPNTDPTSNNTRATTTTLNGEDDKVFENLDIADMEWFSSFIYDTADSFSLGLPTAADIGGADASRDNKEESMFRTSSPVSVLEPNSISSGGGGSSASSSSSSSCSGDNAGGSNGGRAPVPVSPPLAFVSSVPARARSKRPRTTTFYPRTHVAISFLPIQSPDCPPLSLPAPEPESFGESITPPTMVKKKKKKKSSPPSDGGGDEEAGPPAARKCAHCQIQKTPQWRAGPLGPKTLCNACGVRYKSGRLFPEYRPAASPTFVSSIHSNSHKKVVEMRLQSSVPGIVSPKSCDLLDYIRRRE